MMIQKVKIQMIIKSDNSKDDNTSNSGSIDIKKGNVFNYSRQKYLNKLLLIILCFFV